MPRPLSLEPAGLAAGPTSLPLQPDLLVGPPVPSTMVSAVTMLATVPPSSQVVAMPSQVLPVPSPMLPNVQDWMKDMKDALFSSMKDQMMDLLGVAPPQSSMSPAVPTRIMGPDALRPPSSSGDRASPRSPQRSGSKRADSCSRSRSSSGDRSLSSRDGRSHRRPHILLSSSDRRSPPSKRLRTVSRSHVLLTSVGAALVPSAIVPRLLLLTIIAAVPLLQVVSPGHVPPSLVIHPRPAWPGDPLGTCRRHQDAVHLLHRRGNHPGAVVRPLAPGGCPLIAVAAPPAQGPLRLALVEDLDPVHAGHAPGPLPGIASLVPPRRNNSCYISGISPQFLNRRRKRLGSPVIFQW